MDFLNDSNEWVFSNHILFGVVLIIFASFCRFQAVANNKAWQDIFDPVQPNLTAGPSPVAKVGAGVIGCITGSVMNVLALALLLAGLDQILFAGSFFEFVAQMILQFAEDYR